MVLWGWILALCISAEGCNDWQCVSGLEVRAVFCILIGIPGMVKHSSPYDVQRHIEYRDQSDSDFEMTWKNEFKVFP